MYGIMTSFKSQWRLNFLCSNVARPITNVKLWRRGTRGVTHSKEFANTATYKISDTKRWANRPISIAMYVQVIRFHNIPVAICLQEMVGQKNSPCHERLVTHGKYSRSVTRPLWTEWELLSVDVCNQGFSSHLVKTCMRVKTSVYVDVTS